MSLWPTDQLFRTPATYPAPGFEAEGVRALFYEGLPWRGRPTRIFAWYGAPPHAPGERLPAMVLVHGGGGTAFPDWVRLWMERGYAALAMDTCGGVPSWRETPYSSPCWPRHAHSGPAGWGNFAQAHLPPEEQWAYHAVAAVVLGHSLLRSFPEVDPSRIGVTGVSWGGVLTCLAAGLDPRFAFAAPVYGCGCLGGASVGLTALAGVERAKVERWLELWDPATLLPQAAMPMLWVSGTNDLAFPLDSLQASYRLPQGARHLAIRVRMPHAHGGPGEKPPEIHALAEALCRGGAPLPVITGQGREGRQAWVTFASATPPARAELNYTRALGHWTDRFWNTAPATLEGTTVHAQLPAGTTVYFFNLFDDHDRVTSSEHVELA
jgi:dienelactone hydrolase